MKNCFSFKTKGHSELTSGFKTETKALQQLRHEELSIVYLLLSLLTVAYTKLSIQV